MPTSRSQARRRAVPVRSGISWAGSSPRATPGGDRRRPARPTLPRDDVGDLRLAAPGSPAPVPGRQRRGVDQVPGRRSRLAGSPYGEHPGQHGSLRGQPGTTEHQPQNQGGVGRRQDEGKELGQPRRLTDEQFTAIRRDLEDEMPLAAMARKYGVPRSTLRGRSTVPTRLGRIRPPPTTRRWQSLAIAVSPQIPAQQTLHDLSVQQLL